MMADTVPALPNPSMIFMNYRIDDSNPETTLLETKLITEFGADAIFRDKSGIQGGDDWSKVIENKLNACPVFLVLIGDQWKTIKFETGPWEEFPRLHDPEDWVRREISFALTQKKVIIPVLLGNAKLPAKTWLKNFGLDGLCDHQAMPFRTDLHAYDFENLVKVLREKCPALPKQSPHGGEVKPPTGNDIAVRCQAVLRDFNQHCAAEWAKEKPARFVEPRLAIRTESRIVDHSEIVDTKEKSRGHEPLLTDDEKNLPGDVTEVEQCRRLLSRQPKKPTKRARLCVTEDAGSGKSVFTQHLRAVLASEAGQAVFFDGQAGLVVRWEGRAKSWPFDLTKALEQVLTSDAGQSLKANAVTARQVVDYAFEEQHVCLILDALDQVTDGFTPDGHPITREELLNRVFEFVNNGPGQRCHVIITGRSYVVTRDGHLDRFPSDSWVFATLEGFDEAQQTRYLADFLENRKMTDFIPSYKEVSELMSVPVILNLIAEIATAKRTGLVQGTPVVLDQFQSRGDLYRDAHEKLTDRAAKIGIPAPVTKRSRWEAALCAAAFSMMCDPQQRRNYAVTAEVVPSFRAAAESWAFNIKGEKLEIENWDGLWDELTAFSEFTSYASVDNCGPHLFSWKHKGWMEYFAGLYLAKYAPPEAAAHVSPFGNDPDWYWVWRFAIETPAHLAIEKRRLATLANLFRKPASGRRPNELIYRAWKVMGSAKQVCEEFIRFQREFQELVARKDSVAQQIENSFRPCPPDPTRDSLTFLMGAPESDDEAYDYEKPQISRAVVPFQMLDAPVTKAQFWRYDPGHQHDPAFADDLQRYSPNDECPVIYVTWYDAWCFAKWSCSQLPTEIEWEHGCRAGTTTRYWWGDDLDKSKCTFHGKTTTPANETHANPWGLMEMSGNVYEWCDSWYDGELAKVNDPDFVSEFRALRGGSFVVPHRLRSAVRSLYAPVNRNYVVGFRVSRTRIGF